jgi:uroporphyrinogen-III decarboxylase
MISRERVNNAMRMKTVDRVPVMCQISIGHYFLYSGIDPKDIWFTSEGFAEALIKLREKYSFDGVLINLPGRDPNYKNFINSVERNSDGLIVRWKNGNYTTIPNDDNPHYYQKDGSRYFPKFEQVIPDELFYVEPWDLTDITYPFTWGFEKEPRPFNNFFPEYHFDTIKIVKQKIGNEFSVHSEIFSPWSQFLELLNYEYALMAIMDDPEKSKACLNRFTEGAIDLGKRQAEEGVDAVLISSAFAGGGLISRGQYEEFVLPYEKKIVEEIQKEYDIPIYTHTCGNIGDRLDLMVETGTNGIDTLDPPPLGTVNLEDAKKQLSGKVFIKGNIDPVNTLLYSNESEIKKDVEWRINIGKAGGGFILSSACSIAPHTPPKNIELLIKQVEKFGKYNF